MRVRVSQGSLTKKQAQVLSMASEGHEAKQIAYALGVHIRTVEDHLKKARKATGARNTVALVATAVREGWIA